MNDNILSTRDRTVKSSPSFTDGKLIRCINDVIYHAFFVDGENICCGEKLIADLLTGENNEGYALEELEIFKRQLDTITKTRAENKEDGIRLLEITFKDLYKNDLNIEESRQKVKHWLTDGINQKIIGVLSIRSKQRMQEKTTATDILEAIQ